MASRKERVLKGRGPLFVSSTLLASLTIVVALVLQIVNEPSQSRSKWPTFSTSGCAKCAHFTSKTSFQLLLGGVPRSIPSSLSYIEVDLFDTSTSDLSNFKGLASKGTILGCYIDAGTVESWRPDAKRYPNAILGKSDVGWSGERWVNVASYDPTLAQILEERVKLCKERGFQAVDFDNVDGYQNNTGFKISANQQIAFDTFLANLAHHYGLLVGLKNDLEQFKTLAPSFDFAVEESCLQYQACLSQQNIADGVDAFATAKPIFDVEYLKPTKSICYEANASKVVTNFAQLELATDEVSCQSILQG